MANTPNSYTIGQRFSNVSLSKTRLLYILKIYIYKIPIYRNSNLKGHPVRSRRLFNEYPRSI